MCSESFRTLGLASSWVRTHLPHARAWLPYLYRRNRREGTGHGLQCLSPVPPKQEQAKVGRPSLVPAVASVGEAFVSLTSLPASLLTCSLYLPTFLSQRKLPLWQTPRMIHLNHVCVLGSGHEVIQALSVYESSAYLPKLQLCLH